MAISDEQDYTEISESEAEMCDSDDSQEDPNFDILEEARSRFSNLPVKKKMKSRIEKEMDEDHDDDTDDIEMTVRELDEKDQKSLEVIQKIIEAGQVEKLKVEQCKVYLRKNGLRLTGQKDTLIHRIKDHLSIMNGGGEQKYPASSFVMSCKGDACTGDIVMFEQNVYEMFNIASRSASGPPCGTRVVAGRIVKESYGAAKQQHTFTIEVLWSKGEKPLPPLHPLLIKGRNLYRLKTMRQRWEDEGERQKILLEKHNRGSVARANREARIQEKEMKKTLRESRISRMKLQNEKQEETKRKISPAQPIISAGNPTKQASQQQDVQKTCKPQNQRTEQHGILKIINGQSYPQKKLCPTQNENYSVPKWPTLPPNPTVPFVGILGSQPLTSMNCNQYMVPSRSYSQKENTNSNSLQSLVRGPMDKQQVNIHPPKSQFRMTFQDEQNTGTNNSWGQFQRTNFNYFQSPSRRHNFQQGNNNHLTRVQFQGQHINSSMGQFQRHDHEERTNFDHVTRVQFQGQDHEERTNFDHVTRVQFQGQDHEQKQLCRYYAQRRKYGDRCKYLH